MAPIFVEVNNGYPASDRNDPRCKAAYAKLVSNVKACIKRPNLRERLAKEWRARHRPMISPPMPIKTAGRLVQIGTPHNQPRCLLFHLPPEIRQIVYQYTFGPSLIHVLSLGHRVAHIRCSNFRSDHNWERHAHGRRGQWISTFTVDEREDPNDQLLALCLTCRRLYLEAMPFLLSTPLYSIQDVPRILVTDQWRVGSFMHIRNLSLGVLFVSFPNDMAFDDEKLWPETEWTQTCRTLASMTSLHYLSICIMQDDFNWHIDNDPQERVVNLVNGLFDPLRAVNVLPGGRFEVITQGWKVPYGLGDDLQFELIQERPLPVDELAKRTLDLGEFSRSDYIKLASMPWPWGPRPYSYPVRWLPTPLPP